MSRSGFGFRVSCVRVRGVVRGYSGLGWSVVCGVLCWLGFGGNISILIMNNWQ